VYNIEQYGPLYNNRFDGMIDAHGFMINPEHWTETFAENNLGLRPGDLTNEHLKVIHFIRKKYLYLGALPPLRQVCKSTGIDKPALKIMFGSCLQLWRASGLPRPDDEIRSHMN